MEAELSEGLGREGARSSPVNNLGPSWRANGDVPAPAQSVEFILPTVVHNGHAPALGAVAGVAPVPTVSLVIPTKNEAPNIS